MNINNKKVRLYKNEVIMKRVDKAIRNCGAELFFIALSCKDKDMGSYISDLSDGMYDTLHKFLEDIK